MSEPFSIQMSRARVITVAACFVVAGLLLFAAGTVAGLLAASSSVKILVAEAQAPALKPAAIEPIKNPSIAASTAAAPAASATPSAEAKPASNSESGAAPQTPSPAGSPSQPGAAPVSPAPASTSPASSPAPASAPTTATAAATPQPASSGAAAANAPKESASTAAAAEPGAESSYVIPLAIKVCSFTGKASAEAMVTALAARGYRASLAHSSGADGRTWYVVKLGPYKEWNTASNVAARVAIAENVRPVIGPMQ